jgi:hypothetical protein
LVMTRISLVASDRTSVCLRPEGHATTLGMTEARVSRRLWTHVNTEEPLSKCHVVMLKVLKDAAWRDDLHLNNFKNILVVWSASVMNPAHVIRRAGQHHTISSRYSDVVRRVC